MIREIVTNPHELSVPCRPTTLDEARPVIQDLMDTAHKHKKNCAGLAANQVGSDLRVIVVKINGKFIAFVNPEYVKAGKMFDSKEGCLSFPGKTTTVKRCALITTTAARGKRKGLTLDGLSAVAFQHECDHLNGRMI